MVLSITSVRSTDGVFGVDLLTLDFEHEEIMVAANRSTDKVCFINLLMDVRHRVVPHSVGLKHNKRKD